MTQEYLIDPAKKAWASERQIEFLDAVNKHGSFRAAERALKTGNDVIRRSMRALEERCSMSGFSPAHDMTKVAPGPFKVKGTSSFYSVDPQTGEKVLRGQWVKTKLDDDLKEEAIRAFIEDLADSAKGLSKLVPAPDYVDDDLMTVYPMGDPHFGMYAAISETNESFDLAEADRVTRAAIDRLVAAAPPSKIGVFLELGDLFHSDNESNRTARSGNALDVSSRWSEVIQVALASMQYCIERMKAKHEKVIARFVKGNHDDHSSFAIAVALNLFYSNDPRVQIEVRPTPFWFMRFGRVLIGAAHGNTAKPADLPGIMMVDAKEHISATDHRYFFQGHVHHDSVKEYPGVKVETFRTLAATDAWHTSEGYRSGRDMKCIVLHKNFGEIERHTVGIAQIARKVA
jgi:hypothetical protein